MRLDDTETKLVGFGIGGKGSGVAGSFTLVAELDLADTGTGGFADYVFTRCPELVDLMRRHSGGGATYSVPVGEVFGGSKAHKVALWGMDRKNRRPDAVPFFHADEARFGGKFEVTVGEEGQGIAKFALKVSTGLLGGVSLREVGASLHTNLWVDAEQLQIDTEDDDAAAPRRRQGALDFEGGERGEGDEDDDEREEEEGGDEGDEVQGGTGQVAPGLDEAGPGPHEGGPAIGFNVLLTMVPDHPLAVIRLLVSECGYETNGAAKKALEAVKAGPFLAASFTDEGEANRLRDRFVSAGASVSVERHEVVEDDEQVVDARGRLVGTIAAAAQVGAAGDASQEGPVGSAEGGIVAQEGSGAAGPGTGTGTADPWEPVTLDVLAKRDADGILDAYLDTLDVDQLREQLHYATQKTSRSNDAAFLRGRIAEEARKPVAAPAGRAKK